MPPITDMDLCTSCGICAEVCPDDVLRMVGEDERPEVVYPEECWNCGICMIDCPERAIKIELPLAMRPAFIRVKSLNG